MARELVLVLVLAAVLFGCVADPHRPDRPAAGPGHPGDPASCGAAAGCRRPAGDANAPAAAAGGTSAAPAVSAQPERRRFWVRDRRHYRSPWYEGAHRRMISFGCTPAPYYSPDPRCAHRNGFHHGLDIAMPCGTMLRSARYARVVSTRELGPAYGVHPIRLRNFKHGFDLVIGHTRRVFVQPGDRVRPGTRLARASDSAAPDGCHLHFEKRALKGGLATASHPRKMLRLRPEG